MAAPQLRQFFPSYWQIVIRASLCAQPGNGAPCREHRLEIQLGPRVRFAAFAVVAEGFCSLEYRCNDLRQPVDLRLLEAALRDPRRTEADPAWTCRCRIARDRVPVARNTDNIKYPRCHVPAQRCAVRAHDWLAIHRQQVR